MQAKLPIVATRVGGIPDVLRNNKEGILVEPQDPGSLSEAIETLHTNKEVCLKMSTSAYQKAISSYTSNKMGPDYMQVYQNALNTPYFSQLNT